MDAVSHVLRLNANLSQIPTHGMLDCDLFRLMLFDLGLSEAEIELNLPELRRVAQESYLADGPADLRSCVCPGVVPLLQELASGGIPAALVTGNLSAIGWRKVELAGLRSYFADGAFSEQASTRAGLAQAAVANAKSRDLIVSDARISLIGDHPNDVRAARTNGMQAIATATGLSSFEELQQERPDILVRDLSELRIEQLL
jgi:phosphoglycolate phosphatase-like HAD superfamily hydrolase